MLYRFTAFSRLNQPCQTLCSNSNVVEDSRLLGCGAVSIGNYLPTFRRIVYIHLQGQAVNKASLLELFGSEDAGVLCFEISVILCPATRRSIAARHDTQYLAAYVL